MKFIYPAVFRRSESGGYNAFFPDLECCEAAGDTLDEAIDNANEAARNWISVELEEEEPALPYVSDIGDIETEEGDIIKDSGGARKLRIQIDNNKGKSGGARVIYVDFIKLDRIYLLAVYPKSKQETLTQSQVNSVKKLVKSLKNEGGN